VTKRGQEERQGLTLEELTACRPYTRVLCKAAAAAGDNIPFSFVPPGTDKAWLITYYLAEGIDLSQATDLRSPNLVQITSGILASVLSVYTSDLTVDPTAVPAVEGENALQRMRLPFPIVIPSQKTLEWITIYNTGGGGAGQVVFTMEGVLVPTSAVGDFLAAYWGGGGSG